jgi:hypothetical protein
MCIVPAQNHWMFQFKMSNLCRHAEVPVVEQLSMINDRHLVRQPCSNFLQPLYVLALFVYCQKSHVSKNCVLPKGTRHKRTECTAAQTSDTPSRHVCVCVVLVLFKQADSCTAYIPHLLLLAPAAPVLWGL